MKPVNLPVDFSHDFYIRSVPHHYAGTRCEVMLRDYWNDYFPLLRPVEILPLDAEINGHMEKLNWLLF